MNPRMKTSDMKPRMPKPIESPRMKVLLFALGLARKGTDALALIAGVSPIDWGLLFVVAAVVNGRKVEAPVGIGVGILSSVTITSVQLEGDGRVGVGFSDCAAAAELGSGLNVGFSKSGGIWSWNQSSEYVFLLREGSYGGYARPNTNVPFRHAFGYVDLGCSCGINHWLHVGFQQCRHDEVGDCEYRGKCTAFKLIRLNKASVKLGMLDR